MSTVQTSAAGGNGVCFEDLLLEPEGEIQRLADLPGGMGLLLLAAQLVAGRIAELRRQGRVVVQPYSGTPRWEGPQDVRDAIHRLEWIGQSIRLARPGNGPIRVLANNGLPEGVTIEDLEEARDIFRAQREEQRRGMVEAEEAGVIDQRELDAWIELAIAEEALGQPDPFEVG